jgi:hypothetical protein
MVAKAGPGLALGKEIAHIGKAIVLQHGDEPYLDDEALAVGFHG